MTMKEAFENLQKDPHHWVMLELSRALHIVEEGEDFEAVHGRILNVEHDHLAFAVFVNKESCEAGEEPAQELCITFAHILGWW